LRLHLDRIIAPRGSRRSSSPFKLSQIADTFVRAIDTSDFDRGLQILENAGAEESANAVGWYGR
jgi:hypothetical protein